MDAPAPLPTDDAVAAFVGLVLKLEAFFPEFRGEHLKKLFPRSGLYAYGADHRLISQGDVGRDLFILLDGSVSVHQEMGSAAATLATVGPGAILGEMALLEDGSRRASVIVSQPSRIFRLAFADLEYILKHNAALGAHLRELAARRRS